MMKIQNLKKNERKTQFWRKNVEKRNCFLHGGPGCIPPPIYHPCSISLHLNQSFVSSWATNLPLPCLRFLPQAQKAPRAGERRINWWTNAGWFWLMHTLSLSHFHSFTLCIIQHNFVLCMILPVVQFCIILYNLHFAYFATGIILHFAGCNILFLQGNWDQIQEAFHCVLVVFLF